MHVLDFHLLYVIPKRMKFSFVQLLLVLRKKELDSVVQVRGNVIVEC